MANSNGRDSNQQDGDAAAAAAPAPPAKRSLRKPLLLAGILLVGLSGVGAAYATGLVGKMSGGHEASPAASAAPGSVDLPEILANLNAGPRRTSYVKIKARLELRSKSDEPAVLAAQPKMQDMFQTYLRDMRPEELRGSAGTYRLREELVARANIAVAPAKITEILSIEMLVQ